MTSALVLGVALSMTGAGPGAVKPADLAAYQAAKTAAGRDADAHVALALWCEAHGMAAEKSKHLARAVLLDPSNAKARGLLGFVNQDGAWMRPEEVTRAVEESPERQAVFREYQERRVKARDKADDQYRLAQWCDEHDLPQQATAHYHRVVELDSGREGAWRRLGYKKTSGRWVKPEEVAAAKAEREAQAKADKHWKSRLLKLRNSLSDRDESKRAGALEALAKIEDVRAIPAAWAVFAEGDARWHFVALQIFSQIDSPRSSVALATMAVFVPSPELRSRASQVLLRRSPRSYARCLIDLLQDEIEYKIKPVNGPGSVGELWIKGNGKDANVDRLYRPMQGPPQPPPGWVTLDDWGMPVVKLYLGSSTVRTTSSSPLTADVPGSVALANALPQLTPYLQHAGIQTQMAPNSPMASVVLPERRPQNVSIRPGGDVSRPYAYDVYSKTTTTESTVTVPIGRMMQQARESAAVAQQQLSDDVRRLDAYNDSVRGVNERVLTLLRGASGRDSGSKREAWEKWFYDLQGFAYRSTNEPETPTIVEDVPINYQPIPLAFTTNSQVTGASGVSHTHVVQQATGYECLVAGTMVQTIRGARAIETLRAGDQVLTQNTTEGTLKYQPIVTVYHDPPDETYQIDIGGESIGITGRHRLWKAGEGWVAARDFRAGDRLRTVGGYVEVVAVSKGDVQPVFNLLLDGGDNFCVGRQRVLAHDNRLVDLVDHPFDDVPRLGNPASPRKP